jgi:hypothetical protein
MARPRTRLLPGESEYSGKAGPAGVGIRKPQKAVSASDEARLARLTGTKDPKAPINDRVWYGEAPRKTERQRRGDALA